MTNAGSVAIVFVAPAPRSPRHRRDHPVPIANHARAKNPRHLPRRGHGNLENHPRRRRSVAGSSATTSDRADVLIHVVLFRPRPGLGADQRQGLAEALTRALHEIPSVRRLRVGHRVTHGRPYEQLMRADYPYAALIEFDDLSGLRAYLNHPAHEQLAQRFFECFEEGLMYDYEVDDGEQGIRAVAEAPTS